MEAHRIHGWITAAAAIAGLAASYRTENFVVNAPTAEMARQVAEAAEAYRRELGLRWLGRPMPPWWRPCPIRVKEGPVPAGGATTFACSHGEVFGWDMVVQGSLERILHSVLPHEINHTILASHFRHPLARWADEGAATLVEDPRERHRQLRFLHQLLAQRRIIPLRRLLSMREYPSDVMALYAQGYSITHFLVEQGGTDRFLKFLTDARQDGWDTALNQHYEMPGVEHLERQWLAWVQSSGAVQAAQAGAWPTEPSQALAARRRPEPNIIFRGQTPDDEDPPDALAWTDVPKQSHSTAPSAASNTDKRAPTVALAQVAPNSATPLRAVGGNSDPAAQKKWRPRLRSEVANLRPDVGSPRSEVGSLRSEDGWHARGQRTRPRSLSSSVVLDSPAADATPTHRDTPPQAHRNVTGPTPPSNLGHDDELDPLPHFQATGNSYKASGSPSPTLIRPARETIAPRELANGNDLRPVKGSVGPLAQGWDRHGRRAVRTRPARVVLPARYAVPYISAPT